jgi:hypothetical protein
MRPSKNAVSQALRIVEPDLSKGELLALLGVPPTMTTTMRYGLRVPHPSVGEAK